MVFNTIILHYHCRRTTWWKDNFPGNGCSLRVKRKAVSGKLSCVKPGPLQLHATAARQAIAWQLVVYSKAARGFTRKSRHLCVIEHPGPSSASAEIQWHKRCKNNSNQFWKPTRILNGTACNDIRSCVDLSATCPLEQCMLRETLAVSYDCLALLRCTSHQKRMHNVAHCVRLLQYYSLPLSEYCYCIHTSVYLWVWD